MTSTVWVTSDTHFAHPNILSYGRERFASIDEHDAALVKAWNDRVKRGDRVWFLGDFAWSMKNRDRRDLFMSLAGDKTLIVGNHDSRDTRKLAWDAVIHYAELPAADPSQRGVGMVLMHYPLEDWRSKNRGAVHLHGHVHGRGRRQHNRFDIGVDSHPDFAPFSLAEAVAHARAEVTDSRVRLEHHDGLRA